jgi:hypothetical protein
MLVVDFGRIDLAWPNLSLRRAVSQHTERLITPLIPSPAFRRLNYTNGSISKVRHLLESGTHYSSRDIFYGTAFVRMVDVQTVQYSSPHVSSQARSKWRIQSHEQHYPPYNTSYDTLTRQGRMRQPSSYLTFLITDIRQLIRMTVSWKAY